MTRTETEYTADGNYVTKQKDARGNEVTNTLDANGKVLSVTDPAGQQVGYQWEYFALYMLNAKEPECW